MANKDNKPPLLTGFSATGAGRGRPLTSPSTSLWMAVIFVAIFFALMSVRRTINKVDDATNKENRRYSPYLSEAPEKLAEINPPPNPDLILNQEDDIPELELETFELEKNNQLIEVRPIEVDLDIQLPEELRPKADDPR